MRTTRTLVIAALAAITALALTATANAQSPTVELSEEPSGVHCPAVSPTPLATDVGAPQTGGASGGCEIHAVGEVELSGHIIGIEATLADCENLELEGHVNENGEGWIDHINPGTEHIGGAACRAQPCTISSNQVMWPGHVEESAPNEFQLSGEFCVVADNTTRECEQDLHISIGPEDDHDYEIVFQAEQRGTNHSGAPNCEVEGELHLEHPTTTHDQIEINHLP